VTPTANAPRQLSTDPAIGFGWRRVHRTVQLLAAQGSSAVMSSNPRSDYRRFRVRYHISGRDKPSWIMQTYNGICSRVRCSGGVGVVFAAASPMHGWVRARWGWVWRWPGPESPMPTTRPPTTQAGPRRIPRRRPRAAESLRQRRAGRQSRPPARVAEIPRKRLAAGWPRPGPRRGWWASPLGPHPR